MAGPDIVTGSDGRQKYRLQVELQWAYPFDPNSPLTLLWAPMGGIGSANLPFMLKGDNGKAPSIREAVDFTALDPADPTPDSFTLVELTPATDTTGQVLKAVVALHTGQDGADGTSTLNPATYGTPVYKRVLQVNSAATGFEYTPQKVVGMHWAASVSAAPAASTAAVTLSTVTIAPNVYPFPTQLVPVGGTVSTGSTADVIVDLVAHLGTATGTVIGRCPGIGGVTDRLSLEGMPDPGTAAADVTIAANAGTTAYLRSEKQSGTATYQTSAAATRFGVMVVAVP